MKYFSLFFPLLLASLSLVAQAGNMTMMPTDSAGREKNLSSRQKVLFDFNPGLIFSNTREHEPRGIGTGYFLDVSYKRIIFTFRNFTGSGNAPEAAETAFMAGINLRKEEFLIAVVAGFGDLKYKCTNGSNLVCYGATEGGTMGFALQAEIGVLLTKVFGIGFTAFSNQNRLRNFSGGMLNLKFGLLR